MTDEMGAEWRQWQEVCKEFQAVVGDINDPRYNKLVAELKTWAELLAKLRESQSDEYRRVRRMRA